MCNLSEGIFERGMEQGMERGMEQGMELSNIKAIRNLMKNARLTARAAMEMLGLDSEMQKKYMPLL